MTFKLIFNEMPVLFLSYVDDILFVFSCLQMYLRKFFKITFMSKCFPNLCGKGRHMSVFLRNNGL